MDNVDMYCNIMQQIRERTEIATYVKNHEKITGSRRTDIEFICLQIRKILELISLGSLVLNKDLFEEQSVKYEKFYHAERILKDIKEVNPDGYPNPVVEIQNATTYKGKPVANIVDKEEGYLTEKEFAHIYEKCGKIAHAENPFGRKIDYSYYEEEIPLWLNKIIELLNSHTIKLKGDDRLYLIHMKEKRDNKVHGYVCDNTGITMNL